MPGGVAGVVEDITPRPYADPARLGSIVPLVAAGLGSQWSVAEQPDERPEL
jgi:hypothetical protein